MMLICPARPHAHKVRLLALDHYLVIGILLWSFGSLRSFGATGFIRIGDGEDLHSGMIREDDVHVVAVVPTSGMSNDDRPIALLRERFCCLSVWRDCGSQRQT